MRAARAVTIVLVVGLLVAAPSAFAADTDIAFETITLNNLTAAEIAPLFGDRFQFVGKEPAAVENPPRASAVPPVVTVEGVELITAGTLTSRYLLVAGTAQGVAELRSLISSLDVRSVSVPITVTVYPSRPSDQPGWRQHSVGVGEGLPPVIMYLASKERLGHRPAFPSGVEPTEIKLTLADLTPELIALPAYKGFPQVIVCLTPRSDGRGEVMLSLSFGGLGGSGDLLAVVREARYSGSVNVSARIGEEYVMIIPCGDRAITLLVRPDKP